MGDRATLCIMEGEIYSEKAPFNSSWRKYCRAGCLIVLDKDRWLFSNDVVTRCRWCAQCFPLSVSTGRPTRVCFGE